MYRLARILIVICLAAFFPGMLNARPRSSGLTFSYSGIGLSYQHDMDAESFAEIQFRAETAGMFNGNATVPGLSASFTWNLILSRFTSRNGNDVDIFVGPGVIGGVSDDMGRPRGYFFGLKGKIGGECTFARRIAVSFSISPVVGVHFGKEDETLNMHLFRNGLLYTIMPEIGIRYAF